MKNLLISSIVLFISCSGWLAGCDSPGTQTQLEEAMRISRSNAEYNADQYMRTNPRFSGEGWRYVARADSFQSTNCLPGDGWADVSFMRSNNEKDSTNVERWPAVCSTMSVDLGCYLTKDLNTKPEITSQFNTCKYEYKIHELVKSK